MSVGIKNAVPQVLHMATPNVRLAVAVMRSYNVALEATRSSPNALTSWIEKNAGEHSRSREFDQSAAVGLLSYMGHPLFPSSDLSTDEQEWESLMSNAEQVLQQESSWTATQIQQASATSFLRIFSSDISWVVDWAVRTGLTGMEERHMLNSLIATFRTVSNDPEPHQQHQP